MGIVFTITYFFQIEIWFDIKQYLISFYFLKKKKTIHLKSNYFNW